MSGLDFLEEAFWSIERKKLAALNIFLFDEGLIYNHHYIWWPDLCIFNQFQNFWFVVDSVEFRQTVQRGQSTTHLRLNWRDIWTITVSLNPQHTDFEFTIYYMPGSNVMYKHSPWTSSLNQISELLLFSNGVVSRGPITDFKTCRASGTMSSSLVGS